MLFRMPPPPRLAPLPLFLSLSPTPMSHRLGPLDDGVSDQLGTARGRRQLRGARSERVDQRPRVERQACEPGAKVVDRRQQWGRWHHLFKGEVGARAAALGAQRAAALAALSFSLGEESKNASERREREQWKQKKSDEKKVGVKLEFFFSQSLWPRLFTLSLEQKTPSRNASPPPAYPSKACYNGSGTLPVKHGRSPLSLGRPLERAAPRARRGKPTFCLLLLFFSLLLHRRSSTRLGGEREQWALLSLSLSISSPCLFSDLFSSRMESMKIYAERDQERERPTRKREEKKSCGVVERAAAAAAVAIAAAASLSLRRRCLACSARLLRPITAPKPPWHRCHFGGAREHESSRENPESSRARNGQPPPPDRPKARFFFFRPLLLALTSAPPSSPSFRPPPLFHSQKTTRAATSSTSTPSSGATSPPPRTRSPPSSA